MERVRGCKEGIGKEVKRDITKEEGKKWKRRYVPKYVVKIN